MEQTTTHDDGPPEAAPGPDFLEGHDFLEGYVSEEEYARRRGVSLRTCQRDRQLRQAPPYVQFGRRIYYRVEAVRDWLVRHEREHDKLPDAIRARRGR